MTDVKQILDELHEADQAWRTGKMAEMRRAVREAEARIMALRVRRDMLAAQARDAGATWAQVGASLSTKAVATARQAADWGRALLPNSEGGAAHDPRISWDIDAGVLEITITAEELEPVAQYSPYTPEQIKESPELLTARFEPAGASWALCAGENVSSPVSLLLLSPGSELMRAVKRVVGGHAE